MVVGRSGRFMGASYAVRLLTARARFPRCFRGTAIARPQGMRRAFFFARGLAACGARTGASGGGFDELGATPSDASVPETSGTDAARPSDAGQDVPDVVRRACPGTCSSIGRTDPPMQFSDVTAVG